MSDMANIVVKKADGTTDITYTKISPSGGDGVPAVWRSNSVGSAFSHRPEFRIWFRESADGRQRVEKSTYKYPQISTDTTTGLTSVANTAFFSTGANLPKGMPAADIKEACYQHANLLASALIKLSMEEGVAPT